MNNLLIDSPLFFFVSRDSRCAEIAVLRAFVARCRH